MTYVTAFADQAAVLPGVALVLIVLLSLGWWRAAVAWAGIVFVSDSAVLALKLWFDACGSQDVLSVFDGPSGHVVGSTVLYGGLAALCGAGALAVTLTAIGVAALIGYTRVALHAHTIPEVVAGALIGVACVVVLTHLLGTPPRIIVQRAPRALLLAGAILVPAVLLHGDRLMIEAPIRHAAQGFVRHALGCEAR